MPENPLWIERQGGSLPLTERGFKKLIELFILDCRSKGYFEQAFGITGKFRPDDLEKPRHNPDEFFSYRLGEPWGTSMLKTPSIELIGRSADDIFTLLELLYREAISHPNENGGYTQFTAQVEYASALNRILAHRDPPLELDPTGTIVELVAEPFRRLIDQPLPEDAPQKEVKDRVADAITHYRRRDATIGDRRAAVRDLADVLEYIRGDIKEHMFRKDESALFRLANEFGIRHNKLTTRRDFEEPVWLAWEFYVFLASIRLTLELARRTKEEVG